MLLVFLYDVVTVSVFVVTLCMNFCNTYIPPVLEVKLSYLLFSLNVITTVQYTRNVYSNQLRVGHVMEMSHYYVRPLSEGKMMAIYIILYGKCK